MNGFNWKKFQILKVARPSSKPINVVSIGTRTLSTPPYIIFHSMNPNVKPAITTYFLFRHPSRTKEVPLRGNPQSSELSNQGHPIEKSALKLNPVYPIKALLTSNVPTMQHLSTTNALGTKSTTVAIALTVKRIF